MMVVRPPLIIPLILLLACSSPEEPVGKSSGKLTGMGVEVDGPGAYGSATLTLHTTVQNICSATLITPTLILTAAHCAQSSSVPVWAIKDEGTPGAESHDVVECFVHPNAQGVPLASCDDVDSTATFDASYDMAILRVDMPFTSVAPRSIAPPRSCLGDEEGAPGMARGFAGTATRHRVRSTILASGYRLELIPAGFTVDRGDSGGTFEEGSGTGMLLGNISQDVPDFGLGRTVTAGPFIWGKRVNTGDITPHQWLWSVLDPAGNCTLGSLNDCILPGTSSPLPDTDGDGLPDARDLCPSEPPDPGMDCDGQHCDTDGDFIGDECDSYPGICNHDDPDGDGIPSSADPCPMLDASDTSSSDVDGDGVPDSCDLCPGKDDGAVDDWTADSDGDGVADGCDNCDDPVHPNPSQANCNLDTELLTSAPVLGDACDPNPCPASGPIPSDDIETLSATEFAITNDLIEGHGVAVGSGREGTLRTGFRFCPCDTTRDTPDARQTCAVFGGCALDVNEYDEEFHSWHPMSLGWLAETAYPEWFPTGGIYHEIVTGYAAPGTPMYCGSPPALCSNLHDARWDFFADGTSMGGLEHEPWGEELRSVVWSRAVSYAPADDGMVPFGCNSSTCDPLDGNLNSHYWSGETRWRRGYRRPWGARPEDLIEVSLLPDPICPLCDHALPLPYFVIQCEPGAPCLRHAGPGDPRSVDEAVDDRINTILKAAMAGGELSWLSAGEPPEVLGDSAVRLIGYQPDSRWIELAAVATTKSLDGYDAVQGFADTEYGATGAALLLGGNQHTVFALGGLNNGQTIPHLRALDLSDGSRELRSITGPVLQTVRASALHASGRRACVLHQIGGGPQRIAGIDLGTGVSAEYTGDLWAQLYDQHALSSLPDGGYVLLAWSSWSATYKILVFDLDAQSLIERLKIQGNEAVVGGLRGSARGVSFVVEDKEGGWAPVGVPIGDLDPASDGDIYGMF